jgi:hypothetical protein
MDGVLRVGLVLMVLVTACAPSEEEIQAEFDSYVRSASGCESADECAIASAGCPLGCWVAVRADRVDDVERRAEELIEDYESGGQGCDYDCASPGTPVCTDGRCDAPAE